MDDEFEVTRSSPEDSDTVRRQMLETRSALSDKIGRLEQQVYDTVQGAGEMVENVKQTVQETVENVSTKVRDTVHTVQENMDIRHHVEQQPWGMVCGAVAIGAVAGYMTAPSDDQRLLRHMRRANWDPTGRGEDFASNDPQYPAAADWSSGPQTGPAFAHAAGHESGSNNREASQSDPKACATTSWLSSLASALAPSVDKLRGLAIGAALGVARDMAIQSVPEGISKDLREVFDNLTTSLGGHPVNQSVLSQFGKQATPKPAAREHEQVNKTGEWHESQSEGSEANSPFVAQSHA